jgi:hypothetical protein
LFATGTAAKKKDAEELACLDACIQLDSRGLMTDNLASDAAKRRKRMKELMGDSDDEDSYYDRTLDKKLAAKQEAAMKAEPPKTENLESLTQKQKELGMKIQDLERQIANLKRSESQSQVDDEDDLDAYMSSVNADLSTQKLELLSKEQQELQKELDRVSKLIEFVQPDWLKQADGTSTKPSSGSGSTKQASYPSSSSKIISTRNPNSPSPIKAAPRDSLPSTATDKERRPTKPVDISSKPPQPKKPRVIGPVPQQQLESKQLTQLERLRHGEEVEEPVQQQFKEDAEDVASWVPPANQRGDGKTALNAKFGY